MESIKVMEYEVIVDFNKDNSRFECLRHGEPWRDLIGDNFVLAMFYRVQELENKLDSLTGKTIEIPINLSDIHLTRYTSGLSADNQ